MKRILFILLVLCAFIVVGCKKDPVTYTVEFDSQGGTEIVAQTINENEKAVEPTTPTREGYTFVGWYLGDEEYDFNCEVTNNIILVAKWEEIVVINTYTVTFDSNGGSVVTNQTVNENEKAVEPTTPTREGYTFVGWYLGEDEYDFNSEVTTNITLVAKWEEVVVINTYTVTFNSDGGTVVSNQTVNENEKATRPQDPQKEGYEFKGWYNGETEFDFNTVITTNITLIAKWENVVITYTVTFNSDGGTVVSNQTVKQNERAVEPVAPTKEGFTFLGWYDGVEKFDFEKEINFNITLIAKWEENYVPKIYTITFDSNGGSIVANQTVIENGKVIKPENPTREGFTFIGWYCVEFEYDFNEKVTSNITLIAKWEEDENPEPLPVIYTVTFNSDGGTLLDNQTVNENEKVVKPIDPERSGFVFKGWYLGNEEYNFDEVVTSSFELVAKWEEVVIIKTFSVTFNSDGGTLVDNQTVNENEKVVKPIDPTKEGFTFKGWYLEDEEYDFDCEVTSNITLIAKWEEEVIIKTYTVTFDSDGGTLVDNQTVNENEKATRPQDPEKSGFVFKGWYNGETEFDFNSVITENITLVAKWEKKTGNSTGWLPAV